MQEPASPAGASSAALRAALLDYSQSPGKYRVTLRQPLVLFAALREVLQIAVGRDGEASNVTEDAAATRDAARFFVRTALLFPGADHYALLGVERTVDNSDLKDRYRLMMRLLHPDFSGPGAGSWPADSAVRVNRAYDTLSSAVQRRLYDESLVQVPGSAPVSSPELRRSRPAVVRSDGDARQSHFKVLAVVCALAGIGLVVLIVSSTSSPESVHLVQRAPAPKEPVPAAPKEPDSATLTSPVARLQEALAQLRPAPAPSPAPSKAVDSPVARAAPPLAGKRTEGPHAVAESTPRAAPSLPPEARAPLNPATPQAPEPKQEIMLAAAATLAPPAPAPIPAPASAPPGPLATAMAAPAPAPAWRPATRPGPTLMEAQPLLSQLLQVMESGRGDRILNLLDAEARSKPSAQALSRQYDSIVDGARPVRVSHVEFKAEPGDGRLLVVGHVRVLAGEQAIGAMGKRMVLRAEFASREGNVVITGLSGGAAN